MKKILKNISPRIKIIVAIVGFIASIITIINCSVERILKIIKIILTDILRLIISVLTFKVSIWIIITLIIVLVFTLWIMYKIKNVINSSENEADFLKYKTDVYKNWKIAWDYEKTYDGDYKIIYMRAICFCGCELCCEYDNEKCPNCDKNYKIFYFDEKDAARKIVEYKIRQGTYKIKQ